MRIGKTLEHFLARPANVALVIVPLVLVLGVVSSAPSSVQHSRETRARAEPLA